MKVAQHYDSYIIATLNSLLTKSTTKTWLELTTYIYNNYAPKWRWLVLDIYRTAKQWGKYPRLATDTEVNNCFSILLKQWDNWAQKWRFLTQILLPTITILARNDRMAAAVAFCCRKIKRLKAFAQWIVQNIHWLSSQSERAKTLSTAVAQERCS